MGFCLRKIYDQGRTRLRKQGGQEPGREDQKCHRRSGTEAGRCKAGAVPTLTAPAAPASSSAGSSALLSPEASRHE